MYVVLRKGRKDTCALRIVQRSQFWRGDDREAEYVRYDNWTYRLRPGSELYDFLMKQRPGQEVVLSPSGRAIDFEKDLAYPFIVEGERHIVR